MQMAVLGGVVVAVTVKPSNSAAVDRPPAGSPFVPFVPSLFPSLSLSFPVNTPAFVFLCLVSVVSLSITVGFSLLFFLRFLLPFFFLSLCSAPLLSLRFFFKSFVISLPHGFFLSTILSALPFLLLLFFFPPPFLLLFFLHL